ncbi:MAG: hypothetical protein ACE5PM_02830 [Candidatus Hydrothermarchaeales archaeon]
MCKYAGVADKIGKNFDYIMAGAVVYLLNAVWNGTLGGILSAGIVNPVATILSVIGFICVAVGTILGAIVLVRG